MNKSINPPPLEELARMAEALRLGALPAKPRAEATFNPTREQAPSFSNEESEGVTAIIRLIPGIGHTQWQQWAEAGYCEGWTALPIPAHLRQELRQWLQQKGINTLPPLQNTPLGSASSLASPHPLPALDSLTGMLAPGFFLERLSQEAAKACSRHATLSLALFELRAPNTTPNMPATLTDNAYQQALSLLANSIWKSSRREDSAGRLQPDILALLMPGVGSFAALALAERVMNEVCRAIGLPHDHTQSLAHPSGEAMGANNPFLSPSSASATCALRAGVSEISGEDSVEHKAATLLEQTHKALTRATPGIEATVRERVHLYRKHATPAERETLVLASEKQFLFFGGIQ